MSVTSYLPQERKDAASEKLAAAEAEMIRWQAAWNGRTPDDDQGYLQDRLHGAKAEVGNWERYIKAGCPRVRGTA